MLAGCEAVKSVEAWLNTSDGPQTVFKKDYSEPVAILSDEALQIVGPAY